MRLALSIGLIGRRALTVLHAPDAAAALKRTLELTGGRGFVGDALTGILDQRPSS